MIVLKLLFTLIMLFCISAPSHGDGEGEGSVEDPDGSSSTVEGGVRFQIAIQTPMLRCVSNSIKIDIYFEERMPDRIPMDSSLKDTITLRFQIDTEEFILPDAPARFTKSSSGLRITSYFPTVYEWMVISVLNDEGILDWSHSPYLNGLDMVDLSCKKLRAF